MKTLIRFEFQKILKNKTILGSLVASLFLLAGIFILSINLQRETMLHMAILKILNRVTEESLQIIKFVGL